MRRPGWANLRNLSSDNKKAKLIRSYSFPLDRIDIYLLEHNVSRDDMLAVIVKFPYQYTLYYFDTYQSKLNSTYIVSMSTDPDKLAAIAEHTVDPVWLMDQIIKFKSEPPLLSSNHDESL